MFFKWIARPGRIRSTMDMATLNYNSSITIIQWMAFLSTATLIKESKRYHYFKALNSCNSCNFNSFKSLNSIQSASRGSLWICYHTIIIEVTFFITLETNISLDCFDESRINGPRTTKCKACVFSGQKSNMILAFVFAVHFEFHRIVFDLIRNSGENGIGSASSEVTISASRQLLPCRFRSISVAVESD